MQRVVDVEQPLHHTVDGLVFAALAVIQRQQRNSKHHAKLQQTVQLIQCKEIHYCINCHIEKAPCDLLLRVAAVGADGKHTQRSNTAPVGRQRNQTDEQHPRDLYPHAALFVLAQPQHQQTAQKRPHHTGLVQQVAVVKRDKGMPIHIAVGGK